MNQIQHKTNITTYHRFITKLLVLMTFLTLSLVLLGCETSQVPKPTNLFYINDFAEVLTDATVINIANEGKRLYKDTNSYINSGTELVVSTFLVDNQEDIDAFDSSNLFYQWAVGREEMGLLVLIFFEKTDTRIELIDTKIEVGTRLENFITKAQLELIVDQTLYHATWDDDDYIDLPIMLMYYEILEAIYMNVYDYVSFTYDMEIYELYIASYRSDQEPSRVSMSYIEYALFQIGIDNDILLISISMFTVLLISLSYYIIRRDTNLTILKREKNKNKKEL
ncbi:TPM domain-containing protein [Mariniplasma anaerobium]|uniref:TPM domain-containing protein n=1 Tax=Mariniplasma anaerobium TaxID=2735436 RepID=A0A7U9TIM2_9MOLU|nr:TPM domain-containing protein [Mariniplasma anaerobium]BCR35894.1 hypothetical protein MPAN_007870 [Mariniplasma anaerobium]